MRKLFNVCLPVERGRERETVIAGKKVRESKKKGKKNKKRKKSNQGSLTDTPAHAV